MSMLDSPSTKYRDFLLATVDIRPVTQIGANRVTLPTGLSDLTCTIWFGGGGGV